MITDKFFTGWELIKRWDVPPFILLEYIREKKLTPYTTWGEIACRPDCEDFQRDLNKLLNRKSSFGSKKISMRQKGVNKNEDYIKIEIEIIRLEKEIEDLESKQNFDPFSWGQYFPQDTEENPQTAMDRICDLFYHEYAVIEIEGGTHPEIEVKISKDDSVSETVNDIARWPQGDSYIPSLEDLEFYKKIRVEAEVRLDSGGAKRVRKSTKHKMKVREVAKRLWKKNQLITIKDMSFRDEINEVFSPKVYSERTLRKWLKDLCPNRKPGRRKTNTI